MFERKNNDPSRDFPILHRKSAVLIFTVSFLLILVKPNGIKLFGGTGQVMNLNFKNELDLVQSNSTYAELKPSPDQNVLFIIFFPGSYEPSVC